MTALSHHTSHGCPGCLATPDVQIEMPEQATRLALSLPTIHCQACISKVENALKAVPGVQSARVNLTRKRVMVEAAPEITAEFLAECVAKAGFEAHELDTTVLGQTNAEAAGRDILMRLAVAGFAAMNVMLLSIAVWSGATDATRDLFHWISAAITLPALAFSAQPFFRNAWSALKARSLNMDVPIALAILLAVVTSLWETALSGKHAYFDAALALTFFLLAGRWLDARARSAARSAAEELTALEVPRTLQKREDGSVVEVDVKDLQPRDLVLLRPGARSPVDGVVTDGQSEVDLSALTGESMPVIRRVGDTVSAGEVNLTGPLVVQASAVGVDTSLHQLAAMVAVAESGRSRYTSLADKAAKLYAPGVHILSALSFLGWFLWSGDIRVSLNIAAAVLIITCPCALGLAVPAVTTAASGRLFAKGLLIKNATALERLAEVDTVVFDKTGTVTSGIPAVTNWEGLPTASRELAVALAAASSHPLAKSIAAQARQSGTSHSKVENITEEAGNGITAQFEGRIVRLGRPGWIGGVEPDAGLCTVLDLGDGKHEVITFQDSLRPGAAQLVHTLQSRGLRVMLLSGDRPQSVEATAGELGIKEYFSQKRPDEKLQIISDLAADGHRVLMVGDGLNDTGALAAAHVSISPAQALDAARAASDIVLLGHDLAPVGDAISIARVARRRIVQNFRIATYYNIIAVPLAVIGLATPLIAALAMSSSSLTVSLNALRLKERST